MTCLKKDQVNFRRKDGAIGQVTIGSKQNPICVPSHSAITVPGQTNKISPKITCLVEQAQHHNLPPGIVIYMCVATTKARSMPVILVNTTKQNVWIQQPLLAAELFSADQIEKIEHRANMERQGDNIHIYFTCNTQFHRGSDQNRLNQQHLMLILPPPRRNHLLALGQM